MALALVCVACAQVDEADFAVEVGGGETAFVPLERDDTLTLVRGPQGLQHVFVSLRAPLPVGFHRVALSLRRGSDELGSPLAASFPFSDVEGDASEVVGLLLVVPDAERALRGPATLRAEIETVDEGLGLGEVQVRLAW